MSTDWLVNEPKRNKVELSSLPASSCSSLVIELNS